ncbi:TPA: hypothetical protein ACSP19_002046 [Aeromonas veronii]
MAGVTVSDYLNLLREPEHYEELCQSICTQLSKSDVSEYVTDEFFYVLKCAFKQEHFNQSTTHFESSYLKRVVSKFKTDPNVQELELQIFDAILIDGKIKHGLTSAKVPAIVKIRRDKPLIRPDSILMANGASKLRELLLKEIAKPTPLTQTDQLRGRLLLHLYLIERVESIEQCMFMLTTMPPVHYIDGVIFVEFKYKKEWCRYVLSEVGSLFWMQWLQKQDSKASSMNKPAAYYIRQYLAVLPDWQHDNLGLAKLKLLKKIDHTLRFSPIHYAFYSGYIQSQLLPTSVFVRLMTGRGVVSHFVPESLSEVHLTVREQRIWCGHLNQDNYAGVAMQLIELKRLLAYLRPSPGQSSTAMLAASRTQLSDVFTTWLKQHAICNTPYLWFLVAWVYSLFKHGGQMKRSLKPGTVIDYVSTIGSAFLGVFNGYKVNALDGTDWIELLNKTSDEVKSPSRKGFVLYFAKFLHDSELVPDLPVSELDIAISQGAVDANLVSIAHAEAILPRLGMQSDVRSQDAYLLFCLCFYSGLRRSEAAFLQLSDLDFALMPPLAGEHDYVDLHIRRNNKRGLKSTAANRCLPLDALWPSEGIVRLRERVQYLRAAKALPQSLLFGSSQRTEDAFRLITDLLHQFTGDRSLRVHHLRHSFANWTWFRLNPDQLVFGRQQLSLFQSDFFAEPAVSYFYQRLGISRYSRKGMYVLCHLLGHEEPATTIGSYLHLKDLMGYLAMGAELSVTHKLLTHTLGRSTLNDRCQPGESLAVRLQYETRSLERLVSPKPSPVELSSFLPCIKSLTGCFDAHKKPDTPRDILAWAAILMTCKICSPEVVAQQENLTSGEVRAFLDNAAKVQRFCPGRGKPLPLIPDLAPWVYRMITTDTLVTRPNTMQAMSNRPSSKSDSHSLMVLKYLFSQLQKNLDAGALSWEQIKQGCQIMKYLVPGKGYLIRCPSSKRLLSFLAMCHLLGLKARHIRLRLYLGDMEESQRAYVLQRWSSLLAQTGIQGLVVEQGRPQDNPYLRKHDQLGVMEVKLVNNLLASGSRRQRIFISMLQLMLILSLSLGAR